MVTNSTLANSTNVCSDLSKFPEEWPATSQTIGLVIAIGGTVYVLLMLVLTLTIRYVGQYRHRSSGLIVSSLLGILFLIWCTALREYIGKDKFGCTAYLWLIMSVIPWLCGPLLVRMLQFKHRIVWQERIKNIPLDPTREVGYGELLATKYKASKRNTFRSMALLILFFGIILVTYYFTVPRFRAGCVGCDLELGEILLFAISIVGFGVIIAWEFHRIRSLIKSHATGFSLDLEHELRTVALAFSITIVVWAVLFMVDPGNVQEDGYLTWSYLLVTTGLWFVTYTVPYQLYRAWRINRSSGSASKITLLQVIKDPELVALFEKFLKAEFSFENLRFWLEATRWKASYPGDHVDDSRLSEWRREALDIHNVFVRRTGVMQVNLPSTTVEKLCQTFDIVDSTARNNRRSRKILKLKSNSSKAALAQSMKHLEGDNSTDNTSGSSRLACVTPVVFDEAIDQIYHLMEMDSFERFLKSKQFQAQGQHVINKFTSKSISHLSSFDTKVSRGDTISSVAEDVARSEPVHGDVV